jgi:hypothetical protein
VWSCFCMRPHHSSDVPFTHNAGDQQTADVAVAAVWGLVKGNQKLLRPEAEALGAPGTALAGPLLDIVLRGKVRPCSV